MQEEPDTVMAYLDRWKTTVVAPSPVLSPDAGRRWRLTTSNAARAACSRTASGNQPKQTG
jgi:hypothetical protein